MKKAFNLGSKLAVLLFVFALVACSGGGSGDGGGGGAGNDPGPIDFTQGSDTPMPGQGVDMNLNPDDPLVLTATDSDNLFYSFFGVKEPDGSAKFFDQLLIHELTGADAAELYCILENLVLCAR